MTVSLADLKTYLGLTGSGDNALLTTSIASATSQAERDASRTFSASSNNSRSYSSDGQTTVRIRDVPISDPSRVVTWNGVTLVQNESYWLLPDRRNPAISVTLQLRPFEPGASYKSDPNWFFKNLDHYRIGSNPLDVTMTGIEGHPVWMSDVDQEVTFLAAWFYWRAKSGASGVIQTPTGTEIDLGAEPVSSPVFVRNWAIRTAVVSVG